MNKLMAIATLSIIALAGCAQQTESQQSQTQQQAPSNPICATKLMPGGWSKSEVTPEVEQAVNTVLSQMNSDSKLTQINDVRTQIVNGVNYAIEFTLANGEVWNAVVYKNLRNDYMIEQVAEQGPLCP